MTRPILLWPHPALRRPADPVAAVTDEVRALWDEMVEVMEAMPGVGLAAVQLGVPLALAVVDASDERGRAIRMANPRVLHASARMSEHEESSPCLPGVAAVLARPRAVTVEFLDQGGERRERELVGLWAASAQHQIDHLQGRMYFDRLSRTRRHMLLRKADKVPFSSWLP